MFARAFISLLALIFTFELSAQSHLLYDPTILQNRINKIKEQIEIKRAQDRELIHWGNEIVANNNRKIASGRSDLDPLPESIQYAQQRENQRSKDCLNNNPLSDLYTKTEIFCNFDSVYVNCNNEVLRAKDTSRNSFNELNNSLRISKQQKIVVSLKKLRRRLIKSINTFLVASDRCAAEAKPIIESCQRLYDEALTEEKIAIYVNTCTTESLDAQVTEFYKYMNGAGSPAYTINEVVKNHIELRKQMAEMADTLLKVEGYIKQFEPSSRLPTTSSKEVPTS